MSAPDINQKARALAMKWLMEEYPVEYEDLWRRARDVLVAAEDQDFKPDPAKPWTWTEGAIPEEPEPHPVDEKDAHHTRLGPLGGRGRT